MNKINARKKHKTEIFTTNKNQTICGLHDVFTIFYELQQTQNASAIQIDFQLIL